MEMTGFQYFQVLLKCARSSITLKQSFTTALESLLTNNFDQVERRFSHGIVGPPAFNMFLDLISDHFQRAFKGGLFTKLDGYGVSSGVPLATTTVGEGRQLSPSENMAMERVRLRTAQ